MTLRTRKRKVESLLERHFWDGVWERVGYGNREPCASYEMAPDWYDEVADIAQRAGYDAMDELLSRPKPRIGFCARPEIPARVYADCYAAARLT